MLTLSAQAHVASVQRMLGTAARQLPFITATALTDVARLAKVATDRALPSVFDRPTAFTLRGIAVQPATKAKQEAAVYVRPQQAGAGLVLQETGGTRNPKKRAIVLPAAARTNSYGNLPRNTLARLKARPNVFVGKVGNTAGVWERPKKQKGKQGGKLSPKLLIAFEDRATYKPRFEFKARAERVIRASIAPAFREAIAKAMRTAR